MKIEIRYYHTEAEEEAEEVSAKYECLSVESAEEALGKLDRAIKRGDFTREEETIN